VKSWHVDLTDYFNNDGVSWACRTDDGSFNIWGNTFPAEELPPSGSVVDVGGVSFRWPDLSDAKPNNVRCLGQVIPLPEVTCTGIYLLGASERRTEDPVRLFLAGGAVVESWLALSDFWPETPARFGEVAAVRCSRMHYPRHVQHGMGPTIWRQWIRAPEPVPAVAFGVPDNPAMHIFAVTVIGTPEVRE
jgi:hypothetical protein